MSITGHLALLQSEGKSVEEAKVVAPRPAVKSRRRPAKIPIHNFVYNNRTNQACCSGVKGVWCKRCLV